MEPSLAIYEQTPEILHSPSVSPYLAIYDEKRAAARQTTAVRAEGTFPTQLYRRILSPDSCPLTPLT
jgi:hypothetical protein